MTCMTRKEKFEVEDPEIIVLANGRFAYRAKCPWEGKNGKELWAYKFCSRTAYETSREAPEVSEKDSDDEGTQKGSDDEETISDQ